MLHRMKNMKQVRIGRKNCPVKGDRHQAATCIADVTVLSDEASSFSTLHLNLDGITSLLWFPNWHLHKGSRMIVALYTSIDKYAIIL